MTEPNAIYPVVERLSTGANALRADRRSFMSKAAKLGVGGAITSVAMTGPVAASEHEGDQEVTDVDILNFALSLEHLEATYYTEGLDEFSESDFEGQASPGPTRSTAASRGTGRINVSNRSATTSRRTSTSSVRSLATSTGSP